MAFVLLDRDFAGAPNLVAPNNFQINRVGLTDGAEGLASPVGNMSFDLDTDVAGNTLPFPGQTLNHNLFQTQHQDFHLRFWVIPRALVLTNPLLDSNIPFQIWNTFTVDQTLQGIQNSGTGVSFLTYDLTPGVTTIGEWGLDTFNVQIGTGASLVDVDTTFTFPDGQALIELLAIISNTFNILPEAPLQETWEYQTDVIKSFGGQEQRISLRTDPRRNQRFTVFVESEEERREQYEVLLATIDTITSIPAYEHGTQITQDAASGATRVFFDASKTQMRVGQNIAIINPNTFAAQVFEIQTLYADGADLNGSLGAPITTADIAYPSFPMLINNRSGLRMDSITGDLRIQAEGFAQPSLPRPGAVVTIPTLDGYNIMSREPLRDATELIETRKEILDYDTGLKTTLLQGDAHPRWSGRRQWNIRRYSEPEAEDFMRQFIHDARGAQKAWLLPTWLADLTVAEAPNAGSSALVVNETAYANRQVFETWARIQIQYPTIDPTYHRVSATQIVNDDELQLTLNPPLPNSPEVAQIAKISYLLKVNGSDQITRTHGPTSTVYSWEFITTDFG